MSALPQLWLARTDDVAGCALEHRLDGSERERLQRMADSEGRRRRVLAWSLRRRALSQAHPAVSELHGASRPAQPASRKRTAARGAQS